jgi:hypothetical protein
VTNVRVVFFPLDTKLKLTKHRWSRRTIEDALRLGVEIASHARAAQSFTALTRVEMSKSAMQRLVVEFGRQVVNEQAAEARAMVATPKHEEEGVWRQRIQPHSETMAVSSDGVLIHMIDEGWKEVKAVSISAVTHNGDAASGARGEFPQVALTQHSYRAGLWDAPTFGAHHWAEACRRGVDNAKTVVCVSDGAAWIWAIVFMCFARRIEILDWWHAVPRLWTIAHAHFTAAGEAARWVEAQKANFAHSRLRQGVHAIRLLYPKDSPLPEPVRQAVAYIFHNRRRMDYAAFRQAGYPIGSGTIESACKTVVQARMKQSGMRWSRTGAQSMLALRCLLLSDRWHELASLAPPS